jgi:hypothetical protein
MKVLSAQSREKNQKRGQTLVEFALAIPIFLILIFGIFEFGRVMLTYTSVFTASREAARYAASTEEIAEDTLRFEDCSGIEEAARRVGFFAELTHIYIFYDYHADGFVDIRNFSGNNLPVDGAGNLLPQCGQNNIPQPGLGDQIIILVTADYEPILGIVPDVSLYNIVSRTLIKQIKWKTPIP